MKYYVGIDIQESESLIATYDEHNVIVWKNKDGKQTTPSAIYIDKAGKKIFGDLAYQEIPYNSGEVAYGFVSFEKDTLFELRNGLVTLNTRECTAELIRYLEGCLPQVVSQLGKKVYLFPVPVDFNEEQKAQLSASAMLAGLDDIQMVPVPLAAGYSIDGFGGYIVIDLRSNKLTVSFIKKEKENCTIVNSFVDNSVSETAMVEAVFDKIIKPWYLDKYDIEDDFENNAQCRFLCNASRRAAKAAILDLCSKEETYITLDEKRARAMDKDGEEMLLHICFDRFDCDNVLKDMIERILELTEKIAHDARLNGEDIKGLIFTGRMSQYHTIRQNITKKLNIPICEVDPLTALATGAALFGFHTN